MKDSSKIDAADADPAPQALPSAAGSWPLTFRIRKADLQDAFPVVEPCAGKHIRIRVGRDQVTLCAEQIDKPPSKSHAPIVALWSETTVPLMESASIDSGIYLEFEVSTTLFTEYLCRWDLHGMTASQRKLHPDEHFRFRVDRIGTTSGMDAGPARVRVRDADFSIRHPIRFTGAASCVPRTPSGASTPARVIADVLGALYGFTRATKTDPRTYSVTIRDGQLRFVRIGLMRVIANPGLECTDLTIDHTQAIQIGRILRHFDNDTNVTATDNGYLFESSKSSCWTELRSKAITNDPMSALTQTSNTISVDEQEFLDALTIMLDQVESEPATLRLEICGGQTGDLRIPLPVEGGEAVITCPTVRPHSAEGVEPFAPLQALAETQFLRTIPKNLGGQAVELAFFPKWLVITQSKAKEKFHTAVACRSSND